MFEIAGVKIPSFGAWKHPVTSVRYPANWIKLSTAEERQAIGLKQLPEATAGKALDLESLRREKLTQISARTLDLYETAIEVGGGNLTAEMRQALQWFTLGIIILHVLLHPEKEADFFPRTILVNGTEPLELHTVDDADDLWRKVTASEDAVARNDAILRRSVLAAKTIEELTGVRDER